MRSLNKRKAKSKYLAELEEAYYPGKPVRAAGNFGREDPAASGWSLGYHGTESDLETDRHGTSFDDLNKAAMSDFFRAVPYRDTVCTLCEKSVALAFDIPVENFHARTRCSADVALARQIAMYLSQTICC